MNNLINYNRHPLTSIITPVFNAELYLQQTVESVLAQTYPNFEYFLVDDASQDNSRHLMRNLASRDSRIKLLFLDQNGGPAKARNMGIRSSQGEFVTFIDSDDLWAPQKLTRQIETFHGRPQLGIVGINGRLIDKAGNLKSPLFTEEKILRGRISMADFLLKGVPLTISAMVRRESLDHCGIFNEKYRVAEDFELWMRILQCYEVDVLNEELLYYRQHDSNVSHSKFNSRYNKILIYENEVLPNIEKYESSSNAILIKLQKMYTTYGKILLRKGCMNEAIVYLNKSIILKKKLITTVRAIIYKTICEKKS